MPTGIDGIRLNYQFALNHDILAFNKKELLSQALGPANYERRIKLGVPGFDSIDLWKCKHAVRWIISTLIWIFKNTNGNTQYAMAA